MREMGSLVFKKQPVQMKRQMKRAMTAFVFFFSRGSPLQTLAAAQRFTIICINLQMWLSSGFEVAEFAFLLDPCVNVSKLFQET